MTAPRHDSPHDVLAAEEFGMGTGDPALHVEPVRDVLAAEEFVLGAADPSLRRGSVTLPEEPYASAAAHDVLAAEEFAVPAGPQGMAGAESRRGSAGRGRWLLGGALVGSATLLWRRRH
jgi:hypothetical protein